MNVKQMALILGLSAAAPAAWSFCGFYVAQADTKLFNESSKVVLTRNGDVTTMTMSNDFKGDVREFAMVIPVPTVIQRDQIDVSSNTVVDHLDAYSAPRLVEYWDPDPCPEPYEYAEEERYDRMAMDMPMPTMSAPRKQRDELGVKVEASYDVGEYDILVLSAKDSGGLETWLLKNGYKIPSGASSVLASYIKQNMKFFVAKVDLDEHAKLEQPFLRPLKVSYESPKFMLPIRLGMVNSTGTQELFIFTITPKGRVETTNYRNVKIPTDLEVTQHVKNEFGPFYKDMFGKQVANHGMSVVFTEYAWPLSVVCDPCSAEQISVAELQQVGASWATEYHGGIEGGFLTRMHVRYDMENFPEDLVFQETADNATFQGRYIVNHPFEGDTTCDAGRKYEKELAARQSREISNVVAMTGWSASILRDKLPKRANPLKEPKPAPTKDPGNWWESQ